MRLDAYCGGQTRDASRKVEGLRGTERRQAARRRRSVLRAALALVAASASLVVLAGAQGATASVTQFQLRPTASPTTITVGPDGALWFVEEGSNRIGRLTTGGSLGELAIPTPASSPAGITTGPDGNIWFLELKAAKVAQLVPATGQITEFSLPFGCNGIVGGSDGNLWLMCSQANKILMVSTAGAVLATFSVPTGNGFPHGPTLGPDGNVYFAEVNASKIGRITPAGTIKEWRLPKAGSKPLVTAFGPDGLLYFTENAGNRIGRLDPASGSITEWMVPTASSAPMGITAGPDGNLWFTENQASQVASITTSGLITEYPLPNSAAGPKHITTGPDGNLWFTEGAANAVAALTPPPPTPPTPPTNTSPPTISGSPIVGQTLTANTGVWTGATSFGYAWQRCDPAGANCAPIANATGSGYTVMSGDTGATIAVVVTGTNTAGSTTATSPPTAIVSAGGGGGGVVPPSTPILDSFNRSNGAAGANWSLIKPTGFAAMKIVSNAAADASTTSFAWDYWNPTTFGPDAEAYVTLANAAAGDVLRIGARVIGAGTTTVSGYFVSISATGVWSIIRIDNGGTPVTLTTGPTQPLVSGNKVAIQIVGSTITALLGSAGSWTQMTSYDTSADPTRYTGPGSLAIEFRTSTIDDFGGGTLP